MVDVRLVSFGEPGAWRPGLDLGTWVADTRRVAELAGWDAHTVASLRSNRALLALGQGAREALRECALRHAAALLADGGGRPLDGLRLGPPVPDPEKIVCIGLNYHDHAAEVGAKPPAVPMFFAKYANSLAGPTDTIVPPRDTAKVDYEAELAVVIGKPGRYIDAADALQHVAGAMALNDVSARDLQLANPLWTGGKAIDTFAPCGPALVTLEEIPDLQALSVQTRIGDTLLQNGTTAAMIFPVRELVAFLSRIMTLVPGDIIATGTPAGVAMAHKPPRFLQTGDVVEVSVGGFGTLRNPVGPAG